MALQFSQKATMSPISSHTQHSTWCANITTGAGSPHSTHAFLRLLCRALNSAGVLGAGSVEQVLGAVLGAGGVELEAGGELVLGAVLGAGGVELVLDDAGGVELVLGDVLGAGGAGLVLGAEGAEGVELVLGAGGAGGVELVLDAGGIEQVLLGCALPAGHHRDPGAGSEPAGHQRSAGGEANIATPDEGCGGAVGTRGDPPAALATCRSP